MAAAAFPILGFDIRESAEAASAAACSSTASWDTEATPFPPPPGLPAEALGGDNQPAENR
jgi:hypothetical protein